MALVCKECGYKQYDEETIQEYKTKFPNEEEHDIPYVCGACQNEEDEKMNYHEKMLDLLQWMYETVRDFAGSSTYDIPYEWVKDGYNIDLASEDVQCQISDIWCDRYMDLIQAMDFDDLHRKAYVMIWETNNKKKYTIDNYEEFCSNALQAPPIEDFEEGKIDEEQWYKDHMIHITVGKHDIELGYYADNVNEIEYALSEMYAAEHDGPPTTGNTVGSEYPNATWKDILRFAVWYGFCEDSHDLGVEIQKCIQNFYRDTFTKVMKEIDGKTSYNDELKVNFSKLETKDLWKIFDEEERRKAFKEILCSNIEIEELIDKDGKRADKVVITDYSIHPSGHLVGWHYGVDWDKDSEDNQYYIQIYIEEMIG